MRSLAQRIASSAGTIAGIVRKELLQVRQDRRMLGISLVAPILQVLLLGYTATTDIKDSGMVVRDQDRTAESRDLIREFTTSGYFVHEYSVDRDADSTGGSKRATRRWGSSIPPEFRS